MSTPTALAHARFTSAEFDPQMIRFGTDGWRAIIREDFNAENLARVIAAAAQVFLEDVPLTSLASKPQGPPTLLVGYDCRENAAAYATLAGVLLAHYGFKVLISNTYCPTPALCWSIAHDPEVLGGVMLTSSHNPAEYLGVKLRMQDGGASPKSFSDRVEAALAAGLPEAFEVALKAAEQVNTIGVGVAASVEAGTVEAVGADACLGGVTPVTYVDFIKPYLAELARMVDGEAIAAAKLKVVVDPMYGAGRGYLAELLRSLAVEVVEINNAADSSFAGLHPEPILPWIQEGLAKVAELGYDALFITDGDADRIGAGSQNGSFVNPHKILALVCALLVEDKGQSGSVVRTLSGSNLIKRQCERLGLTLITTPIGFKWVYEEMLKGDVILGGEESGGIGIPSHVRERDGLLMALLLTELMAKKGKGLGELVEDLLTVLGHMEYARRDLRLTEEQKEVFLQNVCAPKLEASAYEQRFEAIDEQLVHVDYRDGIKFTFASDAWLLARPSGTEPLVRVYAEAATASQVERLLDSGCALAKGE